MSKHDEFDDFFDSDDAAPATDTRADGRLLKVPLARLSPNKVNPRTEFGTKAELEDLGKSLKRRQNQAIPVVTRSAYLKLWPENRKAIGNVDFVIVSGERRFRGASAVALSALNCVVNDDFAADRKTFMEAVVSENVDRQNFDPVEEAYAVQALVTEFGTNRAVAQHFERVDGWVTQRLALTYLAPEVQTLVRKRAIPLEHARKLGKLARDDEMSADEQVDWWTRTQQGLLGAKEEKKKAKEAAKKVKKAEPSKTTSQQPVSTPEAGSEGGQPTGVSDPRSSSNSGGHSDPSFTAVKQDGEIHTGEEAPAAEVPSQVSRRDNPGAQPPADARQSSGEHHPLASEEAGSQEPGNEAGEADATETSKASQPRQLPYDEPFYVVQHLHLKMTSDNFAQGGRIWMMALRRDHPEAYQALMRELTEQEQPA